MKRSMLITASVLALLLAASPALAVKWGGVTGEYGVKKVNISGMQFLKIGQGARAAAMGDAFTAVADDINAIFWNGSGLVHVENVAYQLNWTRFLARYADCILLRPRGTLVPHVAKCWVFTVASHHPKSSKETTIHQPNGNWPGQWIVHQYVGGSCSMRSSSPTSSRSVPRRTTCRRSYIRKRQRALRSMSAVFSTRASEAFVSPWRSRISGPTAGRVTVAYLMPLDLHGRYCGRSLRRKGRSVLPHRVR